MLPRNQTFPHQCDVVEEELDVEGWMRPDVPGDQSQPAGLLRLAGPDVVNPQQDSHLTGPVSAVSRCQNPLGRDQGASTELTRTGFWKIDESFTN